MPVFAPAIKSTDATPVFAPPVFTPRLGSWIDAMPVFAPLSSLPWIDAMPVFAPPVLQWSMDRHRKAVDG
jgi:hypothetical protein